MKRRKFIALLGGAVAAMPNAHQQYSLASIVVVGSAARGTQARPLTRAVMHLE